MSRETMEFDVIIVGAGPAGLSAAIRLAQLNQEHHTEYRICVLEKGSEVGAHLLSGAVLEPRALNELLPDWRSPDTDSLVTPVTEDVLYYLHKTKAFSLPTPPQMRNDGNYIISLGNLGRWLAKQAEELGVEIYPGFPAISLLFDAQGAVSGVVSGDMGVDRYGKPTSQFQAGMELRARKVLFAEGCRGSLSQQLIQHFELSKNKDPQTYGVGIKELWEIDPNQHQLGKVMHTIGWPLDHHTYGGTFLYHMQGNRVVVGSVIGLDYQNPHLNPYEEFQRFKTHPAIAPIFQGGRRLCYGARAINEGGLQSIPKLSFPGGMLIGCAAGFLNVPKIKGNHTAMKSGMLAAEVCHQQLQDLHSTVDYDIVLQHSWIYDELHAVRNIRPGFQKGLWWGLLNAAFETYISRGRSPWTLHHHLDHQSLKLAKDCHKIYYPKPDGVLTFDRLSSVYLSNTNHKEDQPCHLRLKDLNIPIDVNYALYDAPEQRYCPAGVYEIVNKDGKPALQINAQNCVHCKTCDIKDPRQNIVWLPPEGGDGPNYTEM